jgi:periplasmic divalent cation tolerance protein
MLGGCSPRVVEMSSDLRLVLTTCGNRETADRLADELVNRRMAACVNVLPGVSSTYRWMGKVEHEDEVLLMIKTAKTEMAAIEATIKNVSGYELPELIAVEITDGALNYLSWVASCVGKEVQ